MARDYAQVNVTIWGDPDWRLLPPAAQHLYLTLWTSPTLTYCGTHDWRPARITGLTAGWTTDHIETVAQTLVARHFLVIDHDTEEVLIRSWMKFDGLMRRPRMAIACLNAYSAVASSTLRGVVVSELHKIKNAEPKLTAWTDPRVADVLGHPAYVAKDLPTPNDPLCDAPNEAFAMGLPQTAQQVCDVVCDAPPPTPTPTPLLPNTSDVADAPTRPDIERLCTYLADSIEANGSKRPTITKAWHTAARLMLDKDARTEDQIMKAIDWYQSNPFWRGAIFSMVKLRDQYDKLRLQAIGEAESHQGRQRKEAQAATDLWAQLKERSS